MIQVPPIQYSLTDAGYGAAMTVALIQSLGSRREPVVFYGASIHVRDATYCKYMYCFVALGAWKFDFDQMGSVSFVLVNNQSNMIDIKKISIQSTMRGNHSVLDSVTCMNAMLGYHSSRSLCCVVHVYKKTFV